MKKIISLFLSFVLCLSLCACSGEDDASTTPSSETTYEEETIVHKETIFTTDNAPEVVETTHSEELPNLLVSSDWHRKDENNATIATIAFADDQTGLMEISDGSSYDFTWSVDDYNTIHVILLIDGRDAPGTYTLLEENGVYAIQMTDDASFIYYAE